MGKTYFQIAKMVVLFLILCLTSISAYQLCLATRKSAIQEKSEYIRPSLIDNVEETILPENSALQQKDITINKQVDKTKQ